MAANPRVEALEPRVLPSGPEVAEPQVLSEDTKVDKPRSDIGHPESPTLGESPDSSYEAIARAAYFLAEARGFAPGHELDDWLAAEGQARSG